MPVWNPLKQCYDEESVLEVVSVICEERFRTALLNEISYLRCTVERVAQDRIRVITVKDPIP